MQEAFLTVPYVVALYPKDQNDAPTNWEQFDGSMSVVLKNGFWQLLQSFSLEVQNSSVIQLVPNINMAINYKVLTEISMNELATVAPTYGFFPDTADSFSFRAEITDHSTYVGGSSGSTNNCIFGFEKLYPNSLPFTQFTTRQVTVGNSPVTTGGPLTVRSPVDWEFSNTLPNVQNWSYSLLGRATFATGANTVTQTSVANFGAYQRAKLTSFNPAVLPYSSLVSSATTAQIFRNYYASVACGNTFAKVWYILAMLPLKILSDFFVQCPIIRGLYCRFILNFEQFQCDINFEPHVPQTDTDLPFWETTQSNTIVTGGTLPVMFTSTLPGQPNYLIQGNQFATGKTLQLQGAVRKVIAHGTTFDHPATTVRLYAPLYVMSSLSETEYINVNPTRTIQYRDYYQYTINNTLPNGQINFLASNGLTNLKSVLVIPFFSAGDTGNGTMKIAPQQSIYASEPGTTSPLVFLNNFNLVIAGINIYLNNMLYSWENFTQQVLQSNGVNGNLQLGIGSGVINQYTWSNNYCYFYTNCARRIAADDAVPKSVLLLGQNLSLRSIDLYLFAEVLRSVTFDMLTGSRIE